jgi:hypothetical protein
MTISPEEMLAWRVMAAANRFSEGERGPTDREMVLVNALERIVGGKMRNAKTAAERTLDLWADRMRNGNSTIPGNGEKT